MDEPLRPGEWGRLARGDIDAPKQPAYALVLDWAFGLSGGVLILYSGACGLSAEVNYFMSEVCSGDAEQLWVWLLLLGVLFALRPMWSFVGPKCPHGTLYQATKESGCCFGGCGWIFPLLCMVSLLGIFVGQIEVSAVVYGVTNGERQEDDGFETSFWSGIGDNWENRQWLILFLGVFFNAVVLYSSVTLMLVSWFVPYRRGMVVTIVCVCLKWAIFHQYSQIINGLCLAFEVTYGPIGSILTTYLETIVGTGALYLVAGLFVALALVQVLLFTYAHTPRSDPAGDDSDEKDDGPFGRIGEDGRPHRRGSNDGGQRRWRRGSAAQIGYSAVAEDESAERSQSLFMRVRRRTQKEAVAANWDNLTNRDRDLCAQLSRWRGSAMWLDWVVQFLVAGGLVGFFVCLYIGGTTERSIAMTFVSELPTIPILLPPPQFQPGENGCTTSPAFLSSDTYTSCGQYDTSMMQLLQDIWDGTLGFQHAKFACETDADCDERVGLPCNDGLCQPGPIIKATNKVNAALLTIGPIAIMPQVQVALLAMIWWVPMRIRTMAHFLLWTQMALAWCTLDVWLLMLKIRMDDLERYAISAQESVCEDLGDATPNGVCFVAIGSFPEPSGIGLLAVAAVLQWILTLYIGFTAGGIILQWARDLDEQIEAGSGNGGGIEEYKRQKRVSSAPIPSRR